MKLEAEHFSGPVSMRKSSKLKDLYDSPRFDSGHRSRDAGHTAKKDRRDYRAYRHRKSQMLLAELMGRSIDENEPEVNYAIGYCEVLEHVAHDPQAVRRLVNALHGDYSHDC